MYNTDINSMACLSSTNSFHKNMRINTFYIPVSTQKTVIWENAYTIQQFSTIIATGPTFFPVPFRACTSNIS